MATLVEGAASSFYQARQICGAAALLSEHLSHQVICGQF